jgi:hypothetical protein
MDREPLDPDYVTRVLSRPPFVIIAGVHNVRDISAPGSPIKPNVVFRGAEISSITEKGDGTMSYTATFFSYCIVQARPS